MLILLDVDGVVADFSTAVLREAGSTLTAEDVVQWDIFGLLEPQQAARAKKACGQMSFWESLPVLPDAPQHVENLRRHGDILWVTSPWWSCVGWMSARHKWLKKHFGVKPSDVLCGSAKWAVRGNVLIDDRISNITKWSQHQAGRGLLFDAPYNRTENWPYRVTWDTMDAALTRQPSERSYTNHEVAKMLQVSPSSINKWADAGKLACYRTPGGHRRILHSDLLLFLKLSNMKIPQALDS